MVALVLAKSAEAAAAVGTEAPMAAPHVWAAQADHHPVIIMAVEEVAVATVVAAEALKIRRVVMAGLARV